MDITKIKTKILQHLLWYIGGSFVIFLLILGSAYFVPNSNPFAELPQDTVLAISIKNVSKAPLITASIVDDSLNLPDKTTQSLFDVVSGQLMVIIIDNPWSGGFVVQAKKAEERGKLARWGALHGFHTAPGNDLQIVLAQDNTTLTRLRNVSKTQLTGSPLTRWQAKSFGVASRVKPNTYSLGKIVASEKELEIHMAYAGTNKTPDFIYPDQDTIFYTSGEAMEMINRFLPVFQASETGISWNEILPTQIIEKINGDVALEVSRDSFFVEWTPKNPATLPILEALVEQTLKTVLANEFPTREAILLPDGMLAYELRSNPRQFIKKTTTIESGELVQFKVNSDKFFGYLKTEKQIIFGSALSEKSFLKNLEAKEKIPFICGKTIGKPAFVYHSDELPIPLPKITGVFENREVIFCITQK